MILIVKDHHTAVTDIIYSIQFKLYTTECAFNINRTKHRKLLCEKSADDINIKKVVPGTMSPAPAEVFFSITIRFQCLKSEIFLM